MHKKCCSCNYWEKDRCDFSFLLLILHSHIAFLTTVFPFFISAMSDYFLCNCLFLSSFRNLNFTVLSKRVCLIHYFCTIVIVLIFNSSLFWLDVPFFNWLDTWFSLVDNQKSPRNPSQTIQMGRVLIFKMKMILHPSWQFLFTVWVWHM